MQPASSVQAQRADSSRPERTLPLVTRERLAELLAILERAIERCRTGQVRP
jgi:hypothetical protein